MKNITIKIFLQKTKSKDYSLDKNNTKNSKLKTNFFFFNACRFK